MKKIFSTLFILMFTIVFIILGERGYDEWCRSVKLPMRIK